MPKLTRTRRETCDNCDGRGVIWSQIVDHHGEHWQHRATCDHCLGLGTVTVIVADDTPTDGP